jgi:hypothetical protein
LQSQAYRLTVARADPAALGLKPPAPGSSFPKPGGHQSPILPSSLPSPTYYGPCTHWSPWLALLRSIPPFVRITEAGADQEVPTLPLPHSVPGIASEAPLLCTRPPVLPTFSTTSPCRPSLAGQGAAPQARLGLNAKVATRGDRGSASFGDISPFAGPLLPMRFCTRGRPSRKATLRALRDLAARTFSLGSMRLVARNLTKGETP